MLIIRLVSAFVGIFILLSVLMLENAILINIGVAVISIIALYELYLSFGFLKYKILSFLGFVSAFMFAFSEYLTKEHYLIIMLMFIAIITMELFSHHKTLTIRDFATMFFVTVYVCYLISQIIFIRNMDNGKYYIWLVFIGAFVTDSAAYFFGTYLGKHKLCPEISPKKTVEGAIGGIVFTTVTFLVVGFFFSFFSKYQINYYAITALGFLCGVFAVIGDLFASVIKREYGIKDFGAIMPGHGGVLDRFDSVLFVAPLIYVFLHYFKIII